MADELKLEEYKLDPSLVLLSLAAQSKEEAITRLSHLLLERGYVRDSFAQAVLEREKVFATGLPTVDVKVAIPHTDVEHVIRPALAVGVLKEPVEFQEMGSPENTIQAEIIFLLAMTDPQAQLSLLQKLVQLFQTEGLLVAVKKAKSPEEVVQIFNSQLT